MFTHIVVLLVLHYAHSANVTISDYCWLLSFSGLQFTTTTTEYTLQLRPAPSTGGLRFPHSYKGTCLVRPHRATWMSPVFSADQGWSSDQLYNGCNVSNPTPLSATHMLPGSLTPGHGAYSSLFFDHTVRWEHPKHSSPGHPQLQQGVSPGHHTHPGKDWVHPGTATSKTPLWKCYLCYIILYFVKQIFTWSVICACMCSL